MHLDEPYFHALRTYTKALSVALGYRDLLTRLHSERVCDISMAIGRSCALSNKELETLGIAASFHDIGKIGIPDHILLKPSTLDDAEWVEMKKHAEIGEQIMLSTDFEGAQNTSLAIRQHHENYDGSGYPDGLAGNDINICARIISIADNYDAMAVTRLYHHSRTHAEIMDIMHKETGAKHDPELMRCFSGIIETSKFKASKI